MHGTDAPAKGALAEAERLMTVCNSCRYCEGLCAVFPAMEMRRSFPAGDLDYLASLCHGCGACYYDCQFSPPHEFDVEVPRTLARLRAESYERHAWPGALAGLFRRNGIAVALAAAIGIALFLAGFALANDPAAFWAAGSEPGAFYRLMPHGAMALLFGAAFLYAILAFAFSVRSFWRGITPLGAGPDGARPVAEALHDAATLRYLDGGGVGCMNEDERPTDRRRLFHHLTFYGFLLCFAATSVATLYHYLLGRVAPYPWYDLPVVLGTLGGIGLVIGPAGLLAARERRDPALRDEAQAGMDRAFLAMLLLVSVTGVAVLLVRATPVLGLLLALHLGFVLAFFLTMPYGRFVHGIYRFAALLRYARERRAFAARESAGG
jgi:citrate/tricarballylate utilization protein